MGRPVIPAEIRRAVLVEAGHRCAIPRCGETELDVHHIVSWEICKKHEYSNLIALCPICHRRAHKGEIDRKSLLQYKLALSSGANPIYRVNFEAPVVEFRRQISEVNEGLPGYKFYFDFPDFPAPVQRIVSKNIEAWGYELLASLRSDQERCDALSDQEKQGLFPVPNRLRGIYKVVRNDSKVISLDYRLHHYSSGAAHGGTHTRVQNFLVDPFRPITLTDLLGCKGSLEVLSSVIRSRLLSTGRYSDEEWVLLGTEPDEDSFSKFLIGNYGVDFIFEEYQIACFAAGRQKIHIGYHDLLSIGDPEVIAMLQDHDNYD